MNYVLQNMGFCFGTLYRRATNEVILPLPQTILSGHLDFEVAFHRDSRNSRTRKNKTYHKTRQSCKVLVEDHGNPNFGLSVVVGNSGRPPSYKANEKGISGGSHIQKDYVSIHKLNRLCAQTLQGTHLNYNFGPFCFSSSFAFSFSTLLRILPAALFGISSTNRTPPLSFL